MPATLSPLPVRRSDLRIEPFGPGGDHVVKDPRSGGFYLLGEREHFLLLQLDGQSDAEGVRGAYEHRFGEPLHEEDLDAFVETAREQGMLATGTAPPPRPRQSILYWRKRLFDPDRVFTRLEPRLRFLWTRGFMVASAVAVAFAASLLWANADDLARSMRDAFRLESFVLGWLTLFVVGMLHECAHGLTCKHHGGEVREIGFLFMFFMPCFYCNVSDAWLLREKRKRIEIMLAGGICDLVVWALAVFAWRLTEPGTLVHHIAFLLLGLSGIDTLFNFNPLIKLDGYYVLSDWQEVPNLRERALERAGAQVRRFLWGAAAPDPAPRSRFLTVFGLMSWGFSTVFLVVMLVVLARWFRDWLGPAGYVATAALALPAVVSTLRGLAAGEVGRMIMERRSRLVFWLIGLAGVAAALWLIRVDEYSGGTFTVRPAMRAEIRGPAAGFLRAVLVDEGDRVSAGDVVARLEIPDLDCRLAQSEAERKEAQAQLRLLETGTRPEEIEAQKGRVERAARWHAQAQLDLERMRRTLEEELAALDEHIAEAQLQLEAKDSDYARVLALSNADVASREELEKADQARRVARAHVSLAERDKRAREARGTIVAEEELARREKELGDERARLGVLAAGARPEELAAQQARIDRLDVEIAHLGELRAKLEVRSAVAGVVVTPRLKERTGDYVKEGDLICVVEDRSRQLAEVTLDEEKVKGIEPGQVVRFKARALPYDSIEGRVGGIAPCAEIDGARTQGTLVVHCSMEATAPVLRSSMSGYARIYTGRRRIGAILLDRALRLFRTEFWW